VSLIVLHTIKLTRLGRRTTLQGQE